MILEICIDSVESAVAAERGGAQRLELCSDLLEGGITPSAGLIAQVRRRVKLPVFVLIRPRGGDFAYTAEEFEVMREDIRQARQLGVDGVVLGILNEQAQVDVARTRELVELARPLPVTFHRAIDMTPDTVAALEDVVRTGAARVLTSGGARNVRQGLPQAAAMVRAAGDRIAVMLGSGLSAQGVGSVALSTGATEFHASLRSAWASPMEYQKRGMRMGVIPDREYLRGGVEEEKVRAMARALGQIAERRAR